MKRKTVIVLTLLAFAISLAAVVAIAYGAAPDVVTIDKAQAKKAPVVFPHKTHAESNDCTVCHHTATDGKEPQSCFECHGKDPNAPDPSSGSSKTNPFHIKCKGCHQEKGAGPTKCGDCHKS